MKAKSKHHKIKYHIQSNPNQQPNSAEAPIQGIVPSPLFQGLRISIILGDICKKARNKIQLQQQII